MTRILADSPVVRLADVAHEAGRAIRQPVPRLRRGRIAFCQEAALLFGWIERCPAGGDLLRVTTAGRAAAAVQHCGMTLA